MHPRWQLSAEGRPGTAAQAARGTQGARAGGDPRPTAALNLQPRARGAEGSLGGPAGEEPGPWRLLPLPCLRLGGSTAASALPSCQCPPQQPVPLPSHKCLIPLGVSSHLLRPGIPQQPALAAQSAPALLPPVTQEPQVPEPVPAAVPAPGLRGSAAQLLPGCCPAAAHPRSATSDCTSASSPPLEPEGQPRVHQKGFRGRAQASRLAGVSRVPGRYGSTSVPLRCPRLARDPQPAASC